MEASRATAGPSLVGGAARRVPVAAPTRNADSLCLARSQQRFRARSSSAAVEGAAGPGGSRGSTTGSGAVAPSTRRRRRPTCTGSVAQALLQLAGRAGSKPPSRARRRQLPCCTASTAHNGSEPRSNPVDSPTPARGLRQLTNANFPMDGERRTYHLGTRKGEVANRILSVGSEKRAFLLAEMLQPPAPGQPLFMLESSRGFTTITGRFLGVPVSIVSTHMGAPNMDFVVRENRAVVDGEMAIIRLGTCGALQPPAHLGAFVVSYPGSVMVRRNPDAFTLGNGTPPYLISQPIPADRALSHSLLAEAAQLLGPGGVCEGLNATADSFYSSQGRLTAAFDDRNERLLPELLEAHPGVATLEMETAQLLDLARCSRGSIRATAGVIALADRQSNDFIAAERIEQLERAAGRACLATLAMAQLQEDPGSQEGSSAHTTVWAPARVA